MVLRHYCIAIMCHYIKGKRQAKNGRRKGAEDLAVSWILRNFVERKRIEYADICIVLYVRLRYRDGTGQDSQRHHEAGLAPGDASGARGERNGEQRSLTKGRSATMAVRPNSILRGLEFGALLCPQTA